MKYVWIVMLAIPDLIWAVLSVIDLVFSIKYEEEPHKFTINFFATHIAFITLYFFVSSFFTWLLVR